MKDNKVWNLVELPPNGKTVGSKWLFRKKTDMDGAVHTYKARLMAKGYTQTPGIDYEETFSPVADIRAIMILMSIAAHYDYEIWQMDVKTTFLNGYLSEEIYMKQSKGDVKRELMVSCYTDAGYLTDADDLKSQTGYVFVLNGGAVDWKSAKQSIFATSSAKDEYIAAFDAYKEAVWVRKFIYWLGVIPTIEEPINYALWEVILNGNSAVQMTKYEAGNEIEVPPVNAQQILARTRERKAKSTLLMSIPDEHLVKFYRIKDAKTLWAAIKTRFGGNAESKKIQKNVLKQQFEIFYVSNSEGLDKGYDRFQRLFSLLEIHRSGVSTEDVNQKFLRSLPSVWSNISLITRNKSGIDNMDIDDLYNNLKVYEFYIKGSSGLSSNSHNVAFVSAESTSSTNEFNADYSVSTTTSHISHAQEQNDQDDLEEMDLKWQVAMLSMRVKRFYKKTRRKLEFNRKKQVDFDKPRDARNAGYKERDNEEEATDFALMAFTSNPSSSLSSNSEFNEKEVLDVKEEEVTETVFDNRSSYVENSLANDRFKKVVTRSGRILVSAAKPKAATSTSVATLVNTAGPKQSVNFSKSRSTFHKPHSPIRRSFYNAMVHSRRNLIERINTVGSKAVSAVKRNRVTAIKTLAGNKAYLADYQEINNGGFVAFGSSRGKITGKVLLRVPKQSNMYSFDLQNVVPSRDLTCLKESIGESNLWHMRLGHVNFKTMNKLVKGNLVRGLPSKIFENDHTCVACQKGNQHKATWIWMNSVKGIKGEYSNARTLQQNRVAERKNMNLIEAARTMLADSLLPIKFWPEAVNTACLQDTNSNACTQDNVDVGKEVFDQLYIVFPLWSFISSTFKSSDDKAGADKPKDDTGSKTIEEPVNKEDQAYSDEFDRLISQEKEVSDAADAFRKEFEQRCMDQRGVTKAGNTNSFNIVSNPVNAASTSGTFSVAGPSSPHLDAFIHANTLLHVDQVDS
nr:hypothetical protein [Tanacetum cinerariifolium]